MKAIMGMVFLGIFLCPAPAAAQDKNDKDDVVGAIWKFTMTSGSDKETGQFRVHKHVVYKGAKKVGTIQPNGLETTLTITEFPKLNGKMELKKVKARPPVWRGTLTRTDGTTWNIEVEVKDR